jgi:dTMP kinase
MTKKNLFIAFEGIDGSGKSTQVRRLSDWLSGLGHKVYTTSEPTDSPIGKMIRDIFNHRMEGDQRVIAALFAADRLNHLLHSQEGMIRKLEEGYTVITDRYYFSSYAYHTVHGIDIDWVIDINRISASLLKPDLNIYIDVAPEKSMERIIRGRSTMEMYETLDNLKAVQQKYFEAFQLMRDQEHICFIDGSQPEEQVALDIQSRISAFIAETLPAE